MDLLVFIQAAIYLFKVVTKTHCDAFEHVNVNRDVQVIYEIKRIDPLNWTELTYTTQNHSH